MQYVLKGALRLKISKEKVLQRIKAKQIAERKENYSFRLSLPLMERLKDWCSKHDLTATSVVEELLIDFLEHENAKARKS